MSEAALQLREQLARLPKDERAELAHFLIDTLDDDIDADYDPAWRRSCCGGSAIFVRALYKASPLARPSGICVRRKREAR